MHGTTYILILENLTILRCLEAIFLSSYDQFQSLFIIFVTPEKSIFITLSRLCSWRNDVESTKHFIIHCTQFVKEKRTFLCTLGNFNWSLLENASKVFTQTLIFGNTLGDNSNIISATTDFILSTKRFDEQLI